MIRLINNRLLSQSSGDYMFLLFFRKGYQTRLQHTSQDVRELLSKVWMVPLH